MQAVGYSGFTLERRLTKKVEDDVIRAEQEEHKQILAKIGLHT